MLLLLAQKGLLGGEENRSGLSRISAQHSRGCLRRVSLGTLGQSLALKPGQAHLHAFGAVLSMILGTSSSVSRREAELWGDVPEISTGCFRNSL